MELETVIQWLSQNWRILCVAFRLLMYACGGYELDSPKDCQLEVLLFSLSFMSIE